MLSKFFINRPVFAAVISILLVLMGAISATRLPIAQYPDLAPPIVRVEAVYPGANAQTIADTVAAPVEQEINGVDRMISMNSTSSNGIYGLDISFEPGTNVDLAAVLVQNRVKIAEPKLPDDVRRQGVTTKKQSTALIGVISLRSPKGSNDDLWLANYLALNLKDEVDRIYGVGASRILPAKDYGMRVWLDPEKLRARGLTVNEVSAAIREQNAQVAAGQIGKEPAPAGTDFELTINTQGRLSTPEEFANIIVKASNSAGTDRSIVRIRDLGRVELGTKDYSTSSTFNGQPNAILAVYQLPGANLVDVAGKVREKVDQFAAAIKRSGDGNGDLAVKFFYDSSMFITASLEEVVTTLVEAFVLVFIVVLVFLQSWRTTLIPAITIPVSLVGTLLLLLLFGFSINMLTMFGMVLAIGIVVDDAIVVVENVERNMRDLKLGARDATIRAMSEITGPIIAITLVLMSVFLPAAALTGITGQMYRQFALTIAASTFLSAICALTLSPALCAILLKSHDEGHKGFILFRPLAWLGGIFNKVFDAITRVFVGYTRLSARFAIVSLLLLAGVLAATLTLTARVPGGFVPNEDLGFVVVSAQLPDGASLQRTREVISKVQSIVKSDENGNGGVDGVENVVTLSGFSVIVGNGTPYGNAWIVLKPWAERAKTGRSVEKIMAEINAKLQAVQEAQFFVFSLPAIQGLGNTSGVEMRVQDRKSAGRDALQSSVEQVIGAVFGQSKMAYAYTNYRSGVPQLYLDVDREKTIKLDIPLNSVFETLQTFLGASYVNDFNQFNRTYQVNLQADARFRLTPEDILKLEVRSRSGKMVPLGALVSIRDSRGPERVERYNLYPSASVNGIPKPGTSSGEAIGIMEGIARDVLPDSIGYEWTSMAYQEKQATGSTLVTFGLALLVVYLILAAQYESFFTPISVVLSVPLVVVGAMAALYLKGLDNNVFTQIGLVLLVGLGAKNAILIVEFAREYRAAGKPLVEAAVEAARTRFRPILMTSFAFILGVVPLVIAEGAGAASRRALGTAVFGGMLAGTFLCLLLTPSLYVVVQWIAEKLTGGPRAHPAESPPSESTSPVTPRE